MGVMQKVILDPTDAENTILKVVSGQRACAQTFPHDKRDAGRQLIVTLKKLELDPCDELRVVTGPGSFAAVRTAALVSNVVVWLTGCQLASKKKSAPRFRRCTHVEPFYATPALITPPRR